VFPMHANPHGRTGYTLIEVLLVIVLLGLASALVVPSLGTTDVLRVQAAVRTIVSDLNYAQSDALARQRGRAIVFNTTANSYSIVEVRGATLNPTTDTIYTVELGNTRKFNDAKLVSATFDAGGNTLVYDELGGPVVAPGSTTPGNGGTIVVSGSRSVFNIVVEPYTGRVTVTRVSGP
jgi:prepilin-type N-terminal cleavage/methylation domain-containing protein